MGVSVEEKIIAIHEAGHAFFHIKEGVEIESISIVNDGKSLGGVRRKQNQLEKEPIAKLRMLVSGAASEIVAREELSTPTNLAILDYMISNNEGWRNDFKKAISDSYDYCKLEKPKELDKNFELDEDVNGYVSDTILRVLNECVEIFSEDKIKNWVEKLANLLVQEKNIYYSNKQFRKLAEEAKKLII